MTNIKATKKALIASILSLCMCFSMLLGTTFAWFTDSVTSANNIITAGNLDIELEYWNGTEWADVAGKSDILTNTLWEPGATEVAYLRVKNAGTLALKYQLGININSEKFGTNKAGESFKLSDYINFGIVEKVNGETGAYSKDDTGRTAAINDVTDAKKISAGYTKADSMKPGEELYFALVVWMPTDVSNKANHDGTNIPQINLGINIFATQMTGESDSFGPDYDAEAPMYNVLVKSEAELKEALANAKNGDVIGIKGDKVTWTTGAEHGSTPFVANTNTFSTEQKDALSYITLVGVGEGATFTAIGKGVGPIGIDNGTVIFKNLKIVDESVSYAENSWEFGYLEFRGNTVFENCDIVNAIMMEGDSAKFVNCSFNSNDDNQYAVWVANGEASFENCQFTGARGLKVHEAYRSEVASVSVNNCEFVELSKKPGAALGTLNVATSISLTNNKFIGTQPGDQGNYKYESDTDVTTFKFVDKDNTVVAKDSNSTLPAGLYKDKDGVYYATTTGGLNAGINAADDGDTIVLSKDVEYTGNGYANITKNITLDLNGNNISTTSLGVVAKAGTIKNGTITNPVGSRAALRTWSGVSIENVTVVSPKNGGITVAFGNTLPYIKNVTIEAQTYGIELQYGASVGTIENVTIVAGKNGIVAQAATVSEIKNCIINGKECGVWAQLKGVYDLNLNFVNCNISGGKYGIYTCDEGSTIVPDGVAKLSYDEATMFEGGVKDKEFAFGQLEKGKLVINGAKVAMFISTADELFAFAKAVNEGGNKFSGMLVFLTADIDLENKAWTPIGQTGATEFKGIFDGQGYTIKNMTIKNTDTSATCASGFFGWIESHGNEGVTVKNVKFDNAYVEGYHNVGVIVGYIYGNIENCEVINSTIIGINANNDANGDKVGAIVGYVGDSKINNNKVDNCKVEGNRDVGGLAGVVHTGVNSFNNNSVNGTTVTYITARTYASAGNITSGRTGYIPNDTNKATNVTVNKK